MLLFVLYGVTLELTDYLQISSTFVLEGIDDCCRWCFIVVFYDLINQSIMMALGYNSGSTQDVSFKELLRISI